jgi:hypothetical protein
MLVIVKEIFPVIEAPVAEKPIDAFGELQQPRVVMPTREEIAPPPQPEPPKVVLKPQMRLIPEKHRGSFAHSSTWWQNNIEVYKHNESGRYLYLSREGEGANEKVKGYMYQGATHRFVEISVETALAMAAMSEKKATKGRSM